MGAFAPRLPHNDSYMCSIISLYCQLQTGHTALDIMMSPFSGSRSKLDIFFVYTLRTLHVSQYLSPNHGWRLWGTVSQKFEVGGRPMLTSPSIFWKHVGYRNVQTLCYYHYWSASDWSVGLSLLSLYFVRQSIFNSKDQMTREKVIRNFGWKMNNFV